MAAPAYVPSPALSKPWAEPSAQSEEPHFCVFSAEGACAEVPLTSEPPMPDAEEPLTSEPPLADAIPLTSESDAFLDSSDSSGLDSFPAQYRPEP
ncbi:hypothetical protein ACWDCX_12200 [Streptomyces fungicidicus]|uniref:Uncharacterized protein n=1 Tax=Streptomyces fungicidicus TaxID=68203 RepID=A0A494UZV9_9ACTN|nr:MULTISPECIES: hypothetical protein [Streptomyces]AYL36111.1 hypothetical protein CNQ36_12090 [Streptomyces fungicidicus]QKW00522.1 hypothetical protein HUT14_11885 [Streptomyces sp. NA02536]TQL22476.1 hypothetical protein FBY37_4512 [Streptomyces sp. SLBN-134]